MPASNGKRPVLGVIVVTYAAAKVIQTCLETLMGAKGVDLRVVIVDNGSPDATLDVIRSWAADHVTLPTLPFAAPSVVKPVPLDGSGAGHRVTLIDTGQNTGFAGGVNTGLMHLRKDQDIDRFWILNPDCAVPPDTPLAFATAPGDFSLMGGRIVYLDDPDKIQIDGGKINWMTGVTSNLNFLSDPATTPYPQPADLHFISGASVVASRTFIEAAGLMQEDYFLYYEEVDWAQRRNAPLAYADDALVYHEGGASIGSRNSQRSASVLSLYFLHRARLRFVWRFGKQGLPGALAYSFAKAAQLAISGNFAGAQALLRGTFQLPAPAAVRRMLGI